MPVVMPDRPSRLMRSSSEFGTSTAEGLAGILAGVRDNPSRSCSSGRGSPRRSARPLISKADADSIARAERREAEHFEFRAFRARRSTS